MSVSGISSAMGSVNPYGQGNTDVPVARKVPGQQQQDLATKISVSVTKMALDQEKALFKGILNMLV